MSVIFSEEMAMTWKKKKEKKKGDDSRDVTKSNKDDYEQDYYDGLLSLLQFNCVEHRGSMIESQPFISCVRLSRSLS